MNVESTAMKLLRDLQRAIADRLNSLGNRQSEGLRDNYIFYSASHINRAVGGFLFLREGFQVDAAKLTIRPAMEAMFRIEAARNKPELLYRMAYTERLEIRKWVGPAAVRLDKAGDGSPDGEKQWERFRRIEEEQWKRFRQLYEEQFPKHELVDETIPLIEVAKGAKLQTYYDSHYRMYCKYAHAALVAAADLLNEITDPEDSRTMVCCAFSALDGLLAMGARIPSFESLNERVEKLRKEPRQELKRKQTGVGPRG